MRILIQQLSLTYKPPKYINQESKMTEYQKRSSQVSPLQVNRPLARVSRLQGPLENGREFDRSTVGSQACTDVSEN